MYTFASLALVSVSGNVHTDSIVYAESISKIWIRGVGDGVLFLHVVWVLSVKQTVVWLHFLIALAVHCAVPSSAGRETK